MSIRKPLEKVKHESPEKLIEKGAPVLEDIKQETQKKDFFVNLRIPRILLEMMDYQLKDRIGLSRTAWILEAIQEKIKRSNNE